MRRIAAYVTALATASALGAGWEPPQTLGRAGGRCCSYWHDDVAVAADSHGDAVAAWSDPSKRWLTIASRTTGSDWTIRGSLPAYGEVALDVSREGRVVLATTEPTVQVRTARLPELRWSRAHMVGRGIFDTVAVDVADEGPAVVVWHVARVSARALACPRRRRHVHLGELDVADTGQAAREHPGERGGSVVGS
jgi:hypothetical protein